MATSPLYNWPEPDNTDLVKNGALAIRTAVNAIDTSMGDLLGGTTGQVLSKASNTNMDFTWVAQDDSNAIQNAIVDAKGDLIAASAADTPARLAVGTNGQTLIAASGEATGLKWSPLPAIVGASIYGSGLTIANNTSTIATFPSERFDTAGFHSTSVNTGRFTIPAGYAGWYVINARFRWDKNGTGSRSLIVKKNGSTLSASSEIPGDATIYQGNQINTLDLYAAGDYVEIEVFQSSGGNLSLFTDTSNAEFSIVMVGV